MNPNPYPQGRWTQVVANAATRKSSRNRLMPESVASLVEAPLKELFWGIPESRLVEEASQRLDLALGAAARDTLPAFVDQPGLAVA
jgi:hypothetical protein